MKNTFILGLSLSLVACTSVQVKPVNTMQLMNLQTQAICIVDNPKVIIDDFVPVIQKRLQYHGIASRIVKDEQSCEYALHYSAKRSWDFATYLSWAELKLYQSQNLVAQAEYKLVGGGGLSLMKWQSVETKMTPVVDELLGKKVQK